MEERITKIKGSVIIAVKIKKGVRCPYCLEKNTSDRAGGYNEKDYYCWKCDKQHFGKKFN